jgi:3D (Asp-Asp-Asp) domain-containing protein
MLTKSLGLAAGVAAGCCLFVSCAEQPHMNATAAKAGARRMTGVRTTAYTKAESGGKRNALGVSLSGKHCMSAASDWSRFPLGTRFRIVGTSDEYIIDDYGTALIGTNTIDLYKPTRLEMKRWGVRHVDIDILEWGSEEKSLQVLGPRGKHRCAHQMILALNKKKNDPVATR